MAAAASGGTAAMPARRTGRQAVGVVGRVHHPHRPPAQRVRHLLGLVAGDHQHRARLGGQHVVHHPRDHRLAGAVGQQQLVERRHPARPCRRASTTAGDHRGAARRRPDAGLGGGLLARQRADIGLLQQAADAHAHDLRRPDLQPGEQARQHQIDPVLFRAARAAGQHERGPAADPPDADQVAGIDRHAEMQDLPARAHDARGAHVAPVDHGGGADHDQQLRPLRRSAHRARRRSPRSRARVRSGGQQGAGERGHPRLGRPRWSSRSRFP